MYLLALLWIIIIVLCPADVYAWGAGVHLQLGLQLLDNIHLLPPFLQSLLQTFPHDFLYGCISADITIGKKFTSYLNHCHAWRISKKVLEAARTDQQKACAYGYMAHLAADTVAHSYFVPFKMVRTFNTVLLKHTYWEIRLEAQVDQEVWDLAQKIASENFRHNDGMLRNVITSTIFSFKTNKKIFNSILLLSRLSQWQKMLRSMSSSSKWVLDDDVKDEYFRLAGDIAVSVLCDMEESPYWQADPTGNKAIGVAKAIRKKMMRRWFDGSLTEEQAEQLVKELKPMFFERLTKPDTLKDLIKKIP